jgi:hypothetical protein
VRAERPQPGNRFVRASGRARAARDQLRLPRGFCETTVSACLLRRNFRSELRPISSTYTIHLHYAACIFRKITRLCDEVRSWLRLCSIIHSLLKHLQLCSLVEHHTFSAEQLRALQLCSFELCSFTFSVAVAAFAASSSPALQL